MKMEWSTWQQSQKYQKKSQHKKRLRTKIESWNQSSYRCPVQCESMINSQDEYTARRGESAACDIRRGRRRWPTPAVVGVRRKPCSGRSNRGAMCRLQQPPPFVVSLAFFLPMLNLIFSPLLLPLHNASQPLHGPVPTPTRVAATWRWHPFFSDEHCSPL